MREMRILLVALLLLQGCAASTFHAMVPANLADAAEIPDMMRVRTWGDAGGPAIRSFLAHDAATLKARYAGQARSGQQVTAHLLALSGGADDGAFGAGLLVGWSQRGDRPEFELVTGISSGALIAPFAFLGRDYDRQLAEIFVKHNEGDIYRTNVLAGVFGGLAVADNTPLANLISSYVDQPMLTRIAAERAKGRLLIVGTTNLNAQRPVFWDMGRIAASRHPDAIALFRQVLLASAALPGLFPPVEIPVTAGGKIYHEIHVDGGPTREVFFTPADFRFDDLDRAVGRRVTRHLWIIRNGKLAPEYAEVDASALAIAARSLETLTKNQTIGDLIRMYEKTRADGIDYNLASIPAGFSAPRPVPFATSYMKALYAQGLALGKAGYPWAKAPPGLTR